MTDVMPADPFATEANADDPFATAEDTKGGSGTFTPTPFFDSLAGRLIALIPRSFDAEAPKRADRVEAGGATTEERYTVDMAVLDGGDLTYWYNKRVEGSEERVATEMTIPAADLPMLYTGVWRTEGNVIGRLKKIDGKTRPILLGVVRRVPRAKAKAKGVTIEAVETAYAAWEARDKKGPRPEFSWDVVPAASGSPEADAHRALAGAWYAQARANGFTL